MCQSVVLTKFANLAITLASLLALPCTNTSYPTSAAFANVANLANVRAHMAARIQTKINYIPIKIAKPLKNKLYNCVKN